MSFSTTDTVCRWDWCKEVFDTSHGLADHVLRMHRYLPPGVEEGTPVHDILSQPLSIDGPAAAPTQAEPESPWEKYDPLLHMGVGSTSSGRKTRATTKKEKPKEILSIPFVKKYIQYAKSRPDPVLTKGAAEWIIEVYSELRNAELEKNTRRVSNALLLRIFDVLIDNDRLHLSRHVLWKLLSV